MKHNVIIACNLLFGVLYPALPLFLSKGKYPLLTVAMLLLGLLFLGAAVLLILKQRQAVALNRVAALAAMATGAVLLVLLAWGAAYVRAIFGALGAVIAGTLVMTILAVLNFFWLYPATLLYRFRNGGE
jgi:hypothetical protein